MLYVKFLIDIMFAFAIIYHVIGLVKAMRLLFCEGRWEKAESIYTVSVMCCGCSDRPAHSSPTNKLK